MVDKIANGGNLVDEALQSIPDNSVIKLLGVDKDVKYQIDEALKKMIRTVLLDKSLEGTDIKREYSPDLEEIKNNLQHNLQTFFRSEKSESSAGGLSYETFAKSCKSAFNKVGLELPLSEIGTPKRPLEDTAAQIAKELEIAAIEIAERHHSIKHGMSF